MKEIIILFTVPNYNINNSLAYICTIQNYKKRIVLLPRKSIQAGKVEFNNVVAVSKLCRKLHSEGQKAFVEGVASKCDIGKNLTA